jgi:hypothetical protein
MAGDSFARRTVGVTRIRIAGEDGPRRLRVLTAAGRELNTLTLLSHSRQVTGRGTDWPGDGLALQQRVTGAVGDGDRPG